MNTLTFQSVTSGISECYRTSCLEEFWVRSCWQPATCVCANAGCSASIIGTKDYFGPAALSITLSSKGVESAAKRVAVTITAVDDAPVASDRNLGAVLVNSYETIILPYTDAEEHPATACTTPQTTNVLMITSGCSCTGGVCKVSVQYGGGTGAGLIGFIVQANGLSSNTGTINFNVQTSVPPAVRVLNLDFPYPSGDGVTDVPLLARIKLSGSAVVSDYEFHLVSEPLDALSVVKDLSNAGRTSGMMTNPVYQRGGALAHFEKFSFALRHKTSGEWLSNASLDNPAWAYTCSPGEFNSWSQLPQGPGGQYLLCSADQMIDLSQNCKTGAVGGCDKNFRQIADISLNDYQNSWTGGIGWGVDFVGTYDGGGHTLSHYRPDSSAFAGYSEGGGLFGRLGAGARVENIRMTDAIVDLYTGAISNASDWGIVVGWASGAGVSIRNIEVDTSVFRPHSGSANISAVFGRLGSGVVVSGVDVKDVHLELVPGVYAAPTGMVFGLAEQGAALSRIAVEDSARVSFTTNPSDATRVGGLGGVLQSGAKVQDSYTRATINCSGSDMRYIGKILSLADNSTLGPNSSSATIKNVYAQISHIGTCYEKAISVGTVAAEKGAEAPVMSGIHFQSSGVSDTYAFGNQNFFYSEVIGHTPGGLDNTEFNN